MVEILTHVSRRLRSRPDVLLPMAPLLKQFTSPDPAPPVVVSGRGFVRWWDSWDGNVTVGFCGIGISAKLSNYLMKFCETPVVLSACCHSLLLTFILNFNLIYIKWTYAISSSSPSQSSVGAFSLVTLSLCIFAYSTKLREPYLIQVTEAKLN